MKEIDQLIKLALKEDIGSGDITSNDIISAKSKSTAKIIAKERLVVAGTFMIVRVCKAVDKKIKIWLKEDDGTVVKKGDLIAILEGPTRSLLTAERTVLNFLQRLSGVATETRKYVEAVKETKAKILDTRKTTPGWRIIEKYAVQVGDGVNHRFGLYDMYLIKNNHVDSAGSVTKAVEAVKAKKRQKILIEAEVRNKKELLEALSAGVHVVMLDNFTPKQVSDALKIVKLFKPRPKVEISGNISLKNIKNYARLGVDFISVGAVTHSARAVDISMSIE